MTIDKQKLVKQIVKQLETDLSVLRQAAKATYEAATHEESKPENEYDTRGLEASYLAGAQAKRVGEIEEVLLMYKYLELRTFNQHEEIATTAIVSVEHNGKKTDLFLVPKGGGMTLHFESHTVQIMTPSSPLGEALIGLKLGDIAIVDKGQHTLEYEIINIQ